MFKIISRIVVALVIFLPFSSLLAAEFAHEIKVETMVFKWKVEGEKLWVEISAKTKGWVGIGFNPSVEMKDANIVIGYVKKGKARIRDDFGVSNNVHDKDIRKGGSDDVELVSGVEENGRTTLTFLIPMNSGDDRDRPLSIHGDTVVIMAYNKGRDSFRPQHRFRTRLKVNLGTGRFQVDERFQHHE